jgi:hypothetical protein
MRVTILKQPTLPINGMAFKQWRVGQTYDVSPDVASWLIVEGYARLEMRAGIDRRMAPRDPRRERRLN